FPPGPFPLNPFVVMSPFLLSAVVLAGAVVVAIAAIGVVRGTTAPLVPRELQHLGVLAAVSCLVLLVTGTVVTAAGPHPGDSSKVHRLWRPRRAVYRHARATPTPPPASLPRPPL